MQDPLRPRSRDQCLGTGFIFMCEFLSVNGQSNLIYLNQWVSGVCVEGECESWGRALLEGKGSIHTWPKNPIMARISEYLSSDSFPDSFGDALVTH